MQAARKTGVFVTTIVLEENENERKRKRAKGRDYRRRFGVTFDDYFDCVNSIRNSENQNFGFSCGYVRLPKVVADGCSLVYKQGYEL